ncbi:MAG: ABC transporter permease, partial [Oscillospiraceae bacterium]
MKDIIELQLCQFSLVYLLLIIVLVIMKKCKIEQTKLLIIANIRMAVQLAIAGLILTYIFDNPHPAFTILYLISMTSFAIHRVLSKNKDLNKKFQLSIAVSLAISGLSIVFYFVKIVVG